MRYLVFSVAILVIAAAYAVGNEEMKLHKEVVVNAPLERAWSAWTTSEGAQNFFAPKKVIEPEPGGAYEIHFFPDNPPGQRGAEGLKVLAVEPKRSISFEWNAPPNWPKIRAKTRTRVTVSFEELEGGRTRVSLVHDKWGEGTFEGESWREVYDYFDSAWDTVLRRFVHSMEHEPIDWSSGFPMVEEYQDRIVQHHK
jgi:uncharacterized protein YndB with AHSA1/START domain